MGRTRTSGLRRMRRAVVLALLLLGYLGIAAPEPAAAHSGHTCPGEGVSGFWCDVTRARGVGGQMTLHTDGRYLGQVSAVLVETWLAPPGLRVCDSNTTDGRSVRLVVELASGTVAEFADADPDGCFRFGGSWIDVDRFRALTRNPDTGSLQHTTVWYDI